MSYPIQKFDDEDISSEDNAVGALRDMSNLWENTDCFETISLKTLSSNLFSNKTITSKKPYARAQIPATFRKKIQKSREELKMLETNQIPQENQENDCSLHLGKISQKESQQQHSDYLLNCTKLNTNINLKNNCKIKEAQQSYYEAKTIMQETQIKPDIEESSLSEKSKEQMQNEQFATPRTQLNSSFILSDKISFNSEKKAFSETFQNLIHQKPQRNNQNFHRKCGDLVESSPSFKIRLRSRLQRQEVSSTAQCTTRYSQKWNNERLSLDFVPLKLDFRSNNRINDNGAPITSQFNEYDTNQKSRQKEHPNIFSSQGTQISVQQQDLNDASSESSSSKNSIHLSKKQFDENQLQDSSNKESHSICLLGGNHFLKGKLINQIEKICNTLPQLKLEDQLKASYQPEISKLDGAQIKSLRSNSLQNGKTSHFAWKIVSRKKQDGEDKINDTSVNSITCQDQVTTLNNNNASVENAISNLIFSKISDKRQRLKSLDVQSLQKRNVTIKEKEREESQVAQLSARFNQQLSQDVNSKSIHHKIKDYSPNQFVNF